MNHDAKSTEPGRAGRRGPGSTDCLGAVTSDNITNAHQFQMLRNVAQGGVASLSTRRACWVAARFPVSPQMARAIAELAFGKGAAR